MLRALISRLMVVFLLLMSVEAATDTVSAGEALHGGEYAQHLCGDGQGPDTLDPSQHEPAEQHCENCCHGHTSCPTTPTHIASLGATNSALLHRQAHFRYLALAPPTPPPNA